MGMPSVSTVRNTVCQVIDSTGTRTAVIGQSDPVVIIPQVLFRTVTVYGGVNGLHRARRGEDGARRLADMAVSAAFLPS